MTPGKVTPTRPVQPKDVDDLGDRAVDRVGQRGLRCLQPHPFPDQLPLLEVDQASLDATATDVHAEALHADRVEADRPAPPCGRICRVTRSAADAARPVRAARPRRRHREGRGRARGPRSGLRRGVGARQVQPRRRRHRGGHRLRGADRRPAARRPARRRRPGGGGQLPGGDQRRPLGRRPDRRDGQLPLRLPGLRRVDRRRGRRAGPGGRRGQRRDRRDVHRHGRRGRLADLAGAVPSPSCSPGAGRSRWSRPSSPPGSATAWSSGARRVPSSPNC